MRLPLVVLIFASTLAVGPANVSAEFVYDVKADLQGPLTFLRSDLQTENRYGDDFRLASAVALGSVEWSGKYAGAAERYEPGDFDDRFWIAIHRFAGDAPAPEPIATRQIAPERLTRTDSGFDDVGADIYEYRAEFADLHLGAGHYMLSIANETPADSINRWYWTHSTVGGDGVHRPYENTSEWSTTWLSPYAASFTLRGVTAVPEPASLATLAFALTLGASGAGRLWKKRQATPRRLQP